MSNILERKTINEICPNLRINGGFFNYLNINNNPLNSIEMGIMYSSRSGGKLISSLLDYYIDENNETLTSEQEEIIGGILGGIYGDKWDKLLSSLNIQYNLLNNYKRNETIEIIGTNDSSKTIIEGQRTQSNQYGQQNETFNKGDETHQYSYGQGIETTQYGQDQTTNVYGPQNNTTNNYVNGFNNGNVEDTNTSNQIGTHTDTLTKSQKTDTKTINSKSDSETISSLQDSTTKSQHTDTITKQSVTDTETIDNDTTQNTNKEISGYNTSPQDQIKKEIELRKINIIEIILQDVDKYLTLKIYT